MRFIEKCKRFALTGNVLELSLGVIISSDLGRLATAFVKNVLVRLIQPLVAQREQHWPCLVIGPTS